MFARVFSSKIKPFKIKEAREFAKQAANDSREMKGCKGIYVLEMDQDILSLSLWETYDDMKNFAESEHNERLYVRYSELFVDIPTINTYEVIADFP
jgi:heme-degrading monooxygenase HmoA